MKIRSVRANNHRKAFEVRCARGDLPYPYVRCLPPPSAHDPVIELHVDTELAREGFAYTLESGEEGVVLLDQVLDHNGDPSYVRDMLLHRLTLEALDRLERSPLSKREIIRRLGTSPAQFYRLLDTTNRRKTVDRMVELLTVLDCEVDFTVRERRTA